ncbi:cysteine-rich CWC family protein [Shewanella khirikhana]|uniref:cysteine-rich CWC family protein n=1 Tax=Shewanella TaxID=22 RepID=UPI000F7E6CDA
MSDKSHCPLCARANGCALENGGGIDECWCRMALFPKALPENLAACICAECAARLAKAEQLAIKLAE